MVLRFLTDAELALHRGIRLATSGVVVRLYKLLDLIDDL
jgi:hypothetical protein